MSNNAMKEARPAPEQSTADRTKSAINDVLGVELERITDDANLGEDLGADSLDAVELAIMLEEEFSIEIPDDDIESQFAATARVKDVIVYVERAIGAPA